MLYRLFSSSLFTCMLIMLLWTCLPRLFFPLDDIHVLATACALKNPRHVHQSFPVSQPPF
jgi:hypothetical protein